MLIEVEVETELLSEMLKKVETELLKLVEVDSEAD